MRRCARRWSGSGAIRRMADAIMAHPTARNLVIGGQAIDGTASLEAVGLGHAAHLPAAFLSAGQRRRLSIARLIAVNRPVWLLDEPTSALDTSGQAMIASLMGAHLRSGGIILAATHGPLGIAAPELRIGGDA